MPFPHAGLVAALLHVVAAQDVAVGDFPPCRKSPDLHSLAVPGGGGGARAEASASVFFFGGKGFSWRKKGKHGKKGLKKHVQFFGMDNMWQFDLNLGLWQDTKLVGRRHRAPSERWKFAATSFDNDTRLALFGGCKGTDIKGVLNDLWVFELSCCPIQGRWRRIHTKNPPEKRRGHVVGANATHLIVFGGKTHRKGSGPHVLIDLWALPLAALRGAPGRWSWTRGADFPQEPRWGSTGTMLRTSSGQEVLATFGGRIWAPGGYHYFNDLWLFDPVKDSWHHEHPPEPAPRPRDHHGAAGLDGELFVFGGRDAANRGKNAVLADVWSFSMATGRWTEHPPGTGPAPYPRFMPGVAALHWNGRPALAVAGGELLPGSTKETSLNDVWVYLPRGEDGGWRWLSRSNCGPPTYLKAPKAVGWVEALAALPAGGGAISVAAAAVGTLLAVAALALRGGVLGQRGYSVWRSGATDEEDRAAPYEAFT